MWKLKTKIERPLDVIWVLTVLKKRELKSKWGWVMEKKKKKIPDPSTLDSFSASGEIGGNSCSSPGA